jgi:hypothetical protein
MAGVGLSSCGKATIGLRSPGTQVPFAHWTWTASSSEKLRSPMVRSTEPASRLASSVLASAMNFTSISSTFGRPST